MIGKSSYNYNTFEPKLPKANGNNIDLFNSIFDKNYNDIEDLQKYMKHNKTEVALAIFDTKNEIAFPEYILEAIKND